MNPLIERYSYLTKYTLGHLYLGDQVLHTIERPWDPSPDHRGGVNFESCVPDGEYLLQPFSSPSHPDCYSLENPELDVWVEKQENVEGRWAILIHPGNFVKDVVGCIAPGTGKGDGAVWNSRDAMEIIRDALGGAEHRLIIKPKGAHN